MNTNTFTRAIAAGYYRFLHAYTATWALRLGGTINGLLRDTVAEGMRQVGRWTLPLNETPLDVIPILLRDFGLPSYEGETYFETLARLRRAWDIHAVAGAKAQLDDEAVTGAGMTDADHEASGEPWTFTTDTTDTDGSIPPWGSFSWGDGTIYGEVVDPALARNMLRLMKYFRPARDRWLGFRVPD